MKQIRRSVGRFCVIAMAVVLLFSEFSLAWAVSDTATPEPTTPDLSQLNPLTTPTEREFSGSYSDDQIIVVYKSSKAAEQGISTLEAVLPSPEDFTQEIVVDQPAQPNNKPIAVVPVPEGLSVASTIAIAEQDPEVAYAQPNYIYHLVGNTEPLQVTDQPFPSTNQLSNSPTLSPLSLQPNDPIALVSTDTTNTPNQWYLYDVNALDALGVFNTTHSVTVAILDTGARLTHYDLTDNLNTTDAWDAVNNQALSTSVAQGLVGNNGDVAGHGSHVAGIIGGVLNNSYGISGVAGNNASLLPIMVFDPPASAGDEPGASTASIIAGYNYLMTKAATLNIRVVNMSLGEYGDDDQAFEDVIIQAQNNYGIVSVAAAGNGDTSAASYPSDYPETISVVAVDSTDARESFSDYNSSKDISAPGGDIWSTYYNSDGSFACLDGTSMATPIVSAALAILFTESPSMTVAQAKAALFNTANDLGTPGWDEYYGWGDVNLAMAISSVNWNKHPNILSLDGLTRYSTMAQTAEMYIAAANAKSLPVNTVIVASGENFPDALAASALSGILNAPVLLSASAALSVEAADKLNNINPSTVIIVGGTTSLSTTVASQIKSTLGSNVSIVRQSGSERIATAEALYTYGSTHGTWGKTAFLAYAYNYPDALSIAAYAQAIKAPIFLTATEQLTASTQQYLLNGGFTEIILLGGDDSISNTLEADLTNLASAKGINLDRWAGDDRYQTSVAIARNVLAAAPSTSLQTIGFTTGQNFPDGLVGGPLFGLDNQLILLVDNSTDGSYAINAFLTPNASNINNVLYFGGTNSLPITLRTSLANAVQVS